jgi:hypothetical protein
MPVKGHLTEIVDHVVLGPLGRADNGDLAGGADPAADAVDLPSIGVGAAKSCQNDTVSGFSVGRQMIIVKKQSLDSFAAHQNGGDAFLYNLFLP